MTRLHRLSVYAAVALNGALVMALELLGTRVVGSFYGTSLLVWGALISVTLMAMASGYVVGGIFGRHISLQLAAPVAGPSIASLSTTGPMAISLLLGDLARSWSSGRPRRPSSTEPS